MGGVRSARRPHLRRRRRRRRLGRPGRPPAARAGVGVGGRTRSVDPSPASTGVAPDHWPGRPWRRPWVTPTCGPRPVAGRPAGGAGVRWPRAPSSDRRRRRPACVRTSTAWPQTATRGPRSRSHPGSEEHVADALGGPDGRSPPVQVDANGAYDPTRSTGSPSSTGSGCCASSSPSARDDLAGHRALAARLTTPVCLDESLASPAGVVRRRLVRRVLGRVREARPSRRHRRRTRRRDVVPVERGPVVGRRDVRVGRGAPRRPVPPTGPAAPCPGGGRPAAPADLAPPSDYLRPIWSRRRRPGATRPREASSSPSTTARARPGAGARGLAAARWWGRSVPVERADRPPGRAATRIADSCGNRARPAA